jgi:hypothetical protein
MKKILITFAVVAIFSACSKDHNCTCKHAMNGIQTGVSPAVIDKECNTLNSTTYNEDHDTTYTVVCTED